MLWKAEYKTEVEEFEQKKQPWSKPLEDIKKKAKIIGQKW